MSKTKIEWATDSWNPIRARNLKTGRVGWYCEHKSDGCANCYAEGMNNRLGTGLPFKPGHRQDVELFLDEKTLTQPLHWKRPRMIFVCSMSDLFADFVTDEWIDKIFAVMALCPQHTFQCLTKRAGRMGGYLRAERAPFDCADAALTVGRHLPDGYPGWCIDNWRPSVIKHCTQPARWPLPNVWLGVSAERQEEADERIPLLLDTPAAIRFVSAEPLLGPIDFSPWLSHNPVYEKQAERGVRLSGGSERRPRNNARRDDLAASKTGLGPLATEGGKPTMQAGSGGTLERQGPRILPSRPDDEPNASFRASTSLGVASFQRADSGRPDDQPQGRQEEAECTRQSGTGDLFRAANSRDAYFKGRTRLQSERREKQHGETDADASSGDQAATSGGRKIAADSRRFLDKVSAGVEDCAGRPLGGISWLICGGESGPKARPLNLVWVREIIKQCRASETAVFVKQLGERPYETMGSTMRHSDPNDIGAMIEASMASPVPPGWCRIHEGSHTELYRYHRFAKKGGNVNEWPEDLRVREMP
jgi:protein gp37